MKSLTEIKEMLPDDAVVDCSENTILITKWNWDYEDALRTQKEIREFVFENKQFRFYIFCNHPHCFTNGRGLQKGKSADLKLLVDFDLSNSNLPFPLHQIKRGGGLTFHYPGQWIIYPIISLHYYKISVKDLINSVLYSVTNCLHSFKVPELDYQRSLLGVWSGENKIASLGLEIKRFTTMHGLALNIINDPRMFGALREINPCGLSGDIYTTLSDHSSKNNLIAKFDKLFKAEFCF